ncbi:MAG TPA: tRNA (adenosine(37)-N6)-threonylcarbamoyltransferase complex dimerization subunit type 1 TsaB [Pseudolabrys sp.]
MRVLAIDTALEACSAAVLDTEHGRIAAQESLPMVRGHAEVLIPLIARVMERSRLTFSEIDRIAVTTGPGSFTGLRVGISTARGIALTTGKPAVGLSTLAAYAAPLIAADDTQPVVAVIDARHDHVYLQVFGPGGRTLVAPRIVPLREALRVSATGAPRLIGTAAKMLAAAWPAGERAPASVEQRQAPDIGWVARLGAAAVEASSPPKPLYLREPDAQPQNAAQLARR